MYERKPNKLNFMICPMCKIEVSISQSNEHKPNLPFQLRESPYIFIHSRITKQFKKKPVLVMIIQFKKSHSNESPTFCAFWTQTSILLTRK